MADRHGASWWKKAIRKEEEEDLDFNRNNAFDAGDGGGGDTKVGVDQKQTDVIKMSDRHVSPVPVQLLSVRPAKASPVPTSEPATGASGGTLRRIGARESTKEQIKFFGPFVFLHGEAHIVDQYAKIVFPVLYGIFLLVFFLFHHLHPDTVGGDNDPSDGG